MTTSLAGRAAFWLHPAAYTAPARLAALEPALDLELAARLLATPRLAFRLSRRILAAAGLGAGPPPADSPGFALAREPVAGLRQLARTCGALLHHNLVRAVVLKAERQRLRALLGADAHELAIRRGPFLHLPARPAPPPGGLAAAIEHDGLLCLRARLATEPSGLAERVALKLDPGTGYDVTAADELLGPAGRRILARVCAEGGREWRAFLS